MSDSITFDGITIPINSISFGHSEHQDNRFIYLETDSPLFDIRDIGRKLTIKLEASEINFDKKVLVMSQTNKNGKFQISLQQDPELPPVI